MKNAVNSGDTFKAIGKALAYIPFINHYKEQKYINIINFIFFAFFFVAILKRWIPAPIALVFMTIIRLMFEGFSYALRSINKSYEVKIDQVTGERTVTKRKSGKGGFFTFLAFVGITLSFFVPIIMTQDSSISLMEIMDKLNRLNEGLSTYLGGEYSIGQTLKDFVIYSFISALSILIGYVNRGRLLSFIGLFGIFFYGRMILSIISNSDNASNIFKILDNLDKFGILSREDVGMILLSSPGLILYIISSFFLIIACIKIIKGYSDLYNEKVS